MQKDGTQGGLLRSETSSYDVAKVVEEKDSDFAMAEEGIVIDNDKVRRDSVVRRRNEREYQATKRWITIQNVPLRAKPTSNSERLPMGLFQGEEFDCSERKQDDEDDEWFLELASGAGWVPQKACRTKEKAKPCTSRPPVVGDEVMRIKKKRIAMRNKAGEANAWILEPGERAEVVEIDTDRDFRLRNSAGMESGWALHKDFEYAGQDVYDHQSSEWKHCHNFYAAVRLMEENCVRAIPREEEEYPELGEDRQKVLPAIAKLLVGLDKRENFVVL
jgi:hypothetical protein